METSQIPAKEVTEGELENVNPNQEVKEVTQPDKQPVKK
jgi:hypothetical protein